MDFLSLRVTLFLTFLSVALTNKTGSQNNAFHDSRFKLMSQLTENYEPQILPVVNMSNAVDVQCEMALNQIIEVDEKHQILMTAVWARVFWKDEILTWDPAEFNGIDKVYLSVDSIWKPDIVLYNSVDTEKTAFEMFPHGVAGVTHQGVVYWPSPIIMQSLCKINVDNYPFDIQRCSFKFGSWSYDGLKLNFTSKADKMLINNYVSNIEWEVIDTPCQTRVIYYDCCEEPYPDVTCHLIMRRRPAFYVFNLVMPTALLIVIGLLVFTLPPESGEKVSLAITVLLSLSVYMLIIMDHVPPSAEVIPLLQLFIGGTIGMLTLSTAMAVFVVNFHFRGSYSRPPYWIWCCCTGSFLSTIYCLRKEIKDMEDKDDTVVTMTNFNKSYDIQNNGGGMSLMSTARLNNKGSHSTIYKIKTHAADTGTANNHILQQILAEVQQQNKLMVDRHRDKKEQCLGQAEWRVVAMTLDRLFFVILLIVTLLLSLSTFRNVL